MKKMFLAALCGLGIMSAFLFTADIKEGAPAVGNGNLINVKI